MKGLGRKLSSRLKPFIAKQLEFTPNCFPIKAGQTEIRIIDRMFSISSLLTGNDFVFSSFLMRFSQVLRKAPLKLSAVMDGKFIYNRHNRFLNKALGRNNENIINVITS